MSPRPIAYVVIVIVCLTGAFVYKVRTAGIFGCPAQGYGSDRYLAYCNTTAYGDYDHGAFWFGLEPAAAAPASNADAMFVGSSQMQFAFSTDATRDWFDATGTQYYLLGFSHTENTTFTAPLLQRLVPHARAYVINVERFFEDRVTQPVATLLYENDARRMYRNRRLWQRPHQVICGLIPAVCGENLAFFRRYEDGDWVLNGRDATEETPVADTSTQDRSEWPLYTERAEQFVSALPVPRRCVILTIAPSATTRRAEAEAIGAALGMEMISPRRPDLTTFDGVHLDPESAEKWSAAFFQAASEQLRQCLDPVAAETS